MAIDIKEIEQNVTELNFNGLSDQTIEDIKSVYFYFNRSHNHGLS